MDIFAVIDANEIEHVLDDELVRSIPPEFIEAVQLAVTTVSAVGYESDGVTEDAMAETKAPSHPTVVIEIPDLETEEPSMIIFAAAAATEIPPLPAIFAIR